jgi:hypothetical protein
MKTIKRHALFTIAVVLVAITVPWVTTKLMNHLAEASIQRLVNYCVEKGMRPTWTSSSEGFTRTLYFRCEK